MIWAPLSLKISVLRIVVRQDLLRICKFVRDELFISQRLFLLIGNQYQKAKIGKLKQCLCLCTEQESTGL